MNARMLEAALQQADNAESFHQIREATAAIREALEAPEYNCTCELPRGFVQWSVRRCSVCNCKGVPKQGGEIDMVIVAICAILAVLTTCIVALAVRADQAWDKFSVEHACKVVGKMSGDTFNTIDARGNVGIGSTSPKTGYLCDDGVTYWR